MFVIMILLVLLIVDIERIIDKVNSGYFPFSSKTQQH